MTQEKLAIGSARSLTFSNIIKASGRIKRGLVIQQMHISEQTFAREYLSYMEQSTNITFDYQKREFVWNNNE